MVCYRGQYDMTALYRDTALFRPPCWGTPAVASMPHKKQDRLIWGSLLFLCHSVRLVVVHCSLLATWLCAGFLFHALVASS